MEEGWVGLDWIGDGRVGLVWTGLGSIMKSITGDFLFTVVQI